ncbi:MAG: VacJ family lipoprotein [Desulfovibrionaceae bacterium]|nr:VacJ family lipoprotein [Desulfovibrionaceae bacterium]
MEQAAAADVSAPPASHADSGPGPAKGGASLDIPGDDFSLDDYDDDSPAVAVSDPFESWNRFWFDFNDVLLLKVIKPVHEGYSKVLPASMRSGISNFAHNLGAPVRFFNSVLQGKFTQAGVEFGRFCINTMTSLGLADVASQSKPLYPYHPETENFGHTLAVWGMGEGPYLVWPFVGPSTARESVGMVGDLFAAPHNYFLNWQTNLASSVGFRFNDMDKLYKPYEQVVSASLEPYIAVRNGYLLLLRRIPH